jgi:hypothetical protein
VHVEQKPHDPADAARLYGELEQRATDAVANATVERLGACIEVVVVKVVSKTSMEDLRKRVRVRVLFKVNGVLHDIETSSDELERKIVETIAIQLVSCVMRSITHKDGKLR